MEPGTVVGGYRVVSKLGKGAYGSVYKVVSEIDGKQYALKHSNSPNRIPNDWIREINISVLLKDIPYTAQLRYYFSTDCTDYYLVYDLEKGDLYRFIKAIPLDKRLEKIHILYQQLIDGAFAINSRGIYHGDIKPANILCDGKTIKYADFGLSLVSMCNTSQVLYSLGSTASYRAPEYRRFRVTDKSDGYAVALVMLSYITGRTFPDYSVIDVNANLQAYLSREQYSYVMTQHSDIIGEMSNLLKQPYVDRMALKDSKFRKMKDYRILAVGPSNKTLTYSQQRQIAVYLKIIEQECNRRSYAVAYDCFARYYLQGNDINDEVIYAICRLAKSTEYEIERRSVMIRETPEIVPISPHSKSPALVPPTFDDSDSGQLIPPTFDFDEPPTFDSDAEVVGPFVLDPDEYRKMPPKADYVYDGGHKYDYTNTSRKEIEIELMVLYNLKGCISGCWQDSLHKAFRGLSSQGVTLMLVDKMTSGADMFGNYHLLSRTT